MRHRLTSALVVGVIAALLPSGARAWVRFPPVVPPVPEGEPEPAPPEAVPPETPASPETPPSPETAAQPPAPVPAPAPSPPVEAPPPGIAGPPLEPLTQPWAAPEGVPVLETPARAPVRRPKLSAAIGMGVSYDSVGFSNGDTRALPSFFTTLGIGDGVFGFDLSAFASSAGREERTKQNPVDRLAVDGFGVFRPGALIRPDDRGFDMRVLHALAAELGLGFERDGRSPISGTRFLVHLGARAEVPLPIPAESTEIRLRLAVRRGVGLYTPRLSSMQMPQVLEVGDSAAEVYVAVVAVF
jgi:hypothetical protein